MFSLVSFTYILSCLKDEVIASGHSDGSIRIWDKNIGKIVGPSLFRHQKSVSSLTFSPGGRYLVSGSSDFLENLCLILWDLFTGQTRIIGTNGTYHTDGVNAVSFSSAGGLLASASDDTTIKIWQLALEPESNASRKVNDLRTMIDKTSHLWPEISQNKKLEGVDTCLCVIKQPGIAKAVAWSSDGAQLVSGGKDNKVC